MSCGVVMIFPSSRAARRHLCSVARYVLALRLPDAVSMQTRQPSLEGTGEVRLRRLVKEALRMRLDRIVDEG